MDNDKKSDFFKRFKNLKVIADSDRNVTEFIDDYADDNISLDECIELIIVNLDIRVKDLKEMLVS